MESRSRRSVLMDIRTINQEMVEGMVHENRLNSRGIDTRRRRELEKLGVLRYTEKGRRE